MKHKNANVLKLILKICICVLCATLIFSAVPISGEEEVYQKLLRLHVLANSDTAMDQSLKLLVRDFVLLEIGEELREFSDISEAKEWLIKNKERIQACAEEAIKTEGYEYPVSVELGREVYPRRSYGDIVLPAGEYYSVRICIGSAEGQNWWCVLFPPLCKNVAVEEQTEDTAASLLFDAGLKKESVSLITEGQSTKYVLKFKLLELLEGFFRSLRT